MRVLTLALHPTIDRVVRIRELQPGATFGAEMLMTVPAGKGTNTARTLGCVWPARRQIVAVSWIGQDERRWYAKRLAEISGIRAVLCARPCFTRFACTLLEASGRETHIKERMPPPSRADEAAFLGFWRRLVRRDDIVALCGSAPEGTSSKLLREVYIVARKAGVRALIADSSGAALELAAAAGLDGLKGNAAEIGAWLGLGQALDPAKRVSRRALQDVFARPGAPRAVLCTLGAAGAVLAVPGKLLRAAPPALSGNAAPSCRRDAGAPRQPQSATGCGDAATAGWLWAILQGCALEETLRRAVACGTAKLASPDPGCLDPRYVERLMRKTSIQTVPI